VAADIFSVGTFALPHAGSVIPSAAYTATQSVELGLEGAVGLKVVIVATAKTSSPSVVPTIEAYDPASATWVTVLTGAAITTAAPTTVTLNVNPQMVAVTNITANAMVSPRMRVTMTAGNTDSLTYSVGAVASL
jgi:hypothetical protein